MRSAAALQHWLDTVIADDPILVGHRLLRISRLLCASGFDRSLAHSFQPAGRHDIADLHHGRLTPLVISALHADVLAVDEQALAWSPCGRRDGHLLATLAVINALATWTIFFRRAAAGPENAVSCEKVLTRLVKDLRRGGAPSALLGSVAPSIHCRRRHHPRCRAHPLPSCESKPMRDWLPADLEDAACLLEAHPAYRVLRALPPPDRLPLATPRGKVRTAVVLDVETTSLDWRCGHIIELAACPVRFDPYGQIVGVGATQDWLEHPGYPLPAEIVRLTGLTDADLAGRFIDDDAVLALLGAADVLVAHNAQFDSNWLEHRYPALAGKAWCCSMREIDWASYGCKTRTLGGLLAERSGWFNTRHRADADVDALVALLGHELPTGRNAFAEMLLTASRTTVRVTAARAPFEVKDALEGRRYRWNQRTRAWSIEIAQDALDDAFAWLRAEARCPNPTTTPVTWFERHRQRDG